MFNDLFDQIAKWRHITIQKLGVRKIMISTTVFNIDQNLKWGTNQHIRMISEELCDTEIWSNGFAIGINYILKYIIIWNSNSKNI